MSMSLFTSSMIGCGGIYFGLKAYLDQGRYAREHAMEGHYFGEYVELQLELEKKKAEIQARRGQADCQKWRRVLQAIASSTKH